LVGAFIAYINSLQAAAVYATNSVASTGVSALNLGIAGTNQAVGGTGVAAVGLANGVVLPVANGAILTGLQTVASLMNAVGLLIVVSPIQSFDPMHKQIQY
jgi:hypothetical protein